MLSISKVKSSAQAVSYYEKDDYYRGEDGAVSGQGQWFGRGAERLELSGSVDHDTFKDLLEGRLPNGQELGSHQDGQRVHTPGWDMTFSAPKSVSILIEAGGDERLETAHREAARTAMRWVEDNLATYRQREFLGRSLNKSHNLVTAEFNHHTSREQDPQRHTHYVVLNMTTREDGYWVSLHSKPLYEYKMAAGNIYRAELAAQIQTLGYEIKRLDSSGLFEINAVPDTVREAFQTRREQIKEAMKERGLETAEDAAVAAIMTRKSKRSVDLDALRDEWKDKGQRLGLDVDDTVKTARTAGDQTPTAPFRLDRAIHKAVDRLSEAEAVFSHAELLRWSLAAGMGRARVTEITAEIERWQNRNDLQAARLPNGQKAWTTMRAKEQERRIFEQLDNGKGDVKAIYRSKDPALQLESSGLTQGQQAAVHLIATTKDRFVGVQGRAGTGKTTMLKTTRELLDARGYQLVGMAQNSDAARKMQEASGIPSSTLQKHLGRVRRDLNAIRDAGAWKASLIQAKYEKQVWIVDEASQNGVSELRSLSFAAGRLGARVVLVGDTQQTAAIGAGKPFGLMLDHGMAHVYMTENLRQKDATQRLAVQQTYDRNIDGAMTTLNDRIRVIPEADARLYTIISEWKKLGPERENSYVLTARNREKTQLNEGMRRVLRAEGKLADEVMLPRLMRVFSRHVDRSDAGFYQLDDHVRFPRELSSLGVEAGQYWRVTSVDKKQNVVTLATTLKEGVVSIQWNPEKIAGKGVRAVELFRPRPETLAPGESIRWTRNSREVDENNPGIHLTNGQRLSVVSVADGIVEAETEFGQKLSIDTTRERGQHWDHAYATTVYSSQGGTKATVLVNAEAGAGELFNQKAFLVAITRQEASLHLFADDLDKFRDNVKTHLGDKTSALEGKQALAEEHRDELIQQTLAKLEAAFHSVEQEQQRAKEKEKAEAKEAERQKAIDAGRRGLRDLGRVSEATRGDRQQRELLIGAPDPNKELDLARQYEQSKDLEL